MLMVMAWNLSFYLMSCIHCRESVAFGRDISCLSSMISFNLEFHSVCFTCPFKGLQIVLAFEDDIWRDNGSGWYLVTFTYQWNGDRQTFQECMVSGSSHLTWAGLRTAVNCPLVLFFPIFFVFCLNFYGFYWVV